MRPERRACPHRPFLPPLLALLLAGGCADPVMPGRNNPFDPGGTDYNNPGVELLAGPAEGTVIAQCDVTFRWRGTGKATWFKYQLDNTGWYDWSASDSARFGFLDDGSHQFQIYAKTDIGVVQGPLERRFAVDAAPSPSLISVPWRARTLCGSFVAFALMKKGIGPITEARLVLTYPATALQRINIAPGSCWSVTGGTIIITDNSRAGLIDVLFRLAPAGTATSGDALAVVLFQAVNPLTEDSIVIAPASYLSASGGDTVALTARRGSIITIAQ